MLLAHYSFDFVVEQTYKSLYCQAISHILSEPVFTVLYTAAKYNNWC